VGFVAYAVDEARKSASINDFYVVPEARRRGYGAAMVQAVYAQLDQLGVELVELNVRRDNPQALAFWVAQGFRIALYRLRQYRDPKTGKAYIVSAMNRRCSVWSWPQGATGPSFPRE
jgi:ribosomal protein S18 acetylase RimI-like enzyme